MRMNQLEVYSDPTPIIEAACIKCNKRFTCMRAFSMHLKMTAARHTVDFVNYGNYDMKTGLKDMNRARSRILSLSAAIWVTMLYHI
jgi:hypothetical protein